VLSPGHLRSNVLVKLGQITSRTHAVPLVLFAPTARCNSRCVSCDWWRADGAADLSLDEIRVLAAALPRWGTRVVVLTGGEPLLRPDVMDVADAFRAQGLTMHLLTSGLALERLASAIGPRFQDVTVSLDAHTPELYRQIRGVNGLPAVIAGLKKLRAVAPHVTLRARSTVHRHNFLALPELVAKASELGLDQISFLPADVTSGTFNRSASLPVVDASGPSALLLSEDEVRAFGDVVEGVIRSHARAFAERRILPGPEGLRRMVGYYRAHLGLGPFPAVDCNAPWTSLVIEADGAVRPCFFHPPVGNIRQESLASILAGAMPEFRRALDVATNQTCQRCVCTLKVGLRSKLW
jgi:MoaA/NifB/PqqE/SkfB family radical SAM enzyme